MNTVTDQPTRPTTGVFVVDDHSSYRAVAKAVVDATDGFEVAGLADSRASAVELILDCSPPPDLILLDVNLGDGDGVDVATVIARARPSVKIVFVSALALDELPSSASSSGAAGYLPKVKLSPVTLEQIWAGAYDWRP